MAQENVIEDTNHSGLKFDLYAHSIYNIDNTAQTFSCLFELQIHRQLSKQELEIYTDKPDEFRPDLFSWYPTSAVEVNRMQPHTFGSGNPYYLIHAGDGVWVFELWHCNMTFTETMRLENFPFDVQHYEMRFQWDARDLPNRYKITRGAFKVANTNLIGCDFQTHGHQQVYYLDTKDHQVIHFHAVFGVKRDWHFYALRVILVMAIISFLSNACFFFGDIEDSVSDRFGSISTSLLTTVAFIFIISEWVPPLKYLTFLDVYIYSTFGYIFLIAIEIAVVSSFEWFAEIENIDYLVAGGNVVIWVLFHFVYGMKARRAYQVELQKFRKFKKHIDGGNSRVLISTAAQEGVQGLYAREKCYEKFEEIDDWKSFINNKTEH